jgi:hypothetical protein
MLDVFSYGGSFNNQGDVNNAVSARNVYPTANAPTIGQRVSAMTPFAAGGAYSQDPESSGNPNSGVVPGVGDAPGGIMGKPLTWWVVLVGLLVALMFAAGKAGKGEGFSNIRLSFYNVLTIALAAAVGIGFLKVVFSRFQVPGLTTYIQAL